uniref:EcsC family protein n=1 Tax=Faecalitalea cylindroides TaxID=39483 RepID=UPI00189901EE
KEKYFMLMIIEGALAHESIYEVNERVDSFIESYRSYDIDFQIKQTSKTLASELLYLKFIQGIPIVGIISGFYDSKYMNQISKYANLKYQLRFLKINYNIYYE